MVPHTFVKLVGCGFSLAPVAPFQISRVGPSDLPVVVEGERSRAIVNSDSDDVDSDLLELDVGPDQPWSLVTGVFTAAWPTEFSIISTATPPGFDLVGPEQSLIYIQGPFSPARVEKVERLAAPGQQLKETRIFESIRRVWFEYSFEGDNYFQIHHLIDLEGRVLMITLQVLANACSDALLDKALAFAQSVEVYS